MFFDVNQLEHCFSIRDKQNSLEVAEKRFLGIFVNIDS